MTPDDSAPSAELLAPAGDRDCALAAIENGADAVYFGLRDGFNARGRATNFSLDEAAELLELLHRRGLRGYATLNTLVFSGELDAAERVVAALTGAQVDAVLVQDLGLVRLLRALSPDLPIHASTQMTITSAESARVAQRLGVERVVVGRELSIDEIRRVHEETTVELEAFVHGALCVAYSGQCLTSESLGGRSANRGQCAQACRLPYELVCDGRDVELGDRKYLLSPQDLAGFAHVPQLLAAGVRSLKIEGRLKTPEYVANITRHYRKAIDAALAGGAAQFTPDDVAEMEMSFSRGFSPGWLEGCDHKRLVPGLSSAKRGVRVGVVTAVHAGRVAARLERPLAAGDGVVFEGDRASGTEQGGRVFEVFRNGRPVGPEPATGDVELSFPRGAVDMSHLASGLAIWKTDDPRLTARLRKSFTGPDPLRRTPVDFAVEAIVGEPLRVRAATRHGVSCCAASDEPLAPATRHAATEELFAAQLGRLGGTPFELGSLEARIEGAPMVPLSVLGAIRKRLAAALAEATTARPPRRIDPHAAASLRTQSMAGRAAAAQDGATDAPAELWLLCRTLAQVEAALRLGQDKLYADLADIRQYGEAVALARSAGANLWIATPRIEKPGEQGVFLAMHKRGADGVLVRNLAGVEFFRERGARFVCDFSLNAANPLTVSLLREMGADRVTASYDLNREQLLELAASAPAGALEAVVYQHMPMFHMEHCVFCALLSPGTNKTNCGRPCDRHRVRLRDRTGAEHPLTADVGCRNTLFNATPQSAAEAVPALLAAGVRRFRVELVEEGGNAKNGTQAEHGDNASLAELLRLHRELIAGRVSAGEVWRSLRAANRVGVTRGTLEQRRDPLAIL